MAKAQPLSPKSPSLKAQLEGVSCGATKEQILPIARAWLEAERVAIKAQFMVTNDPAAMLAGHTRVVDELLEALYVFYISPSPNPPPQGGRG